MSVATNWLEKYLAADSRNLDKPDGRPLYAYAMETSEFDSLAKLLPSCRDTSNYAGRFVLGTEWLFVIYAAEWWRRKYKGGAWKWEDVFKSIEWSNISNQQKYELTRKGLKYWGRSIFRHTSGNSAYMMSIVTEGGFPVRLAEREGTHLSRYLRAILNDYAKYQSAGMSAERIAESHELRLPTVFRKPAVFHLAALTIEAIFQLSDEVGDSAQPYEYLEANLPGWRSRLPLPVESDGAKALVNGLLSSAKARRQNKYEQLSLRRQFELGQDGLWHHVAYVELPESIPLEVLADQLSRSVAELPRRLELAVHAESNFTKIASLSKEGEEYIVYTYSVGSLTLPIDASTDVACIVMQSGSGRIGDLTIIGGDGLDPELPTSCYRDADILVVVGQGGLKSRLDSLYVSIPKGANIVDANESQAGGIKTFEFQEDACWLSVVTPLVVEISGGFTCSIIVGAQSDSAVGCVVRGHRAYLCEPSGIYCYIGTPKFYDAGKTRRTDIPLDQVYWAPHDRVSSWSKMSESEPVGLVKARVIRDGNCIFSGRFAVLPTQFKFELNPGSTSQDGQIHVFGLEGAEVVPRDHAVVSVNVADASPTTVLGCTSTAPFAGKFPVDLLWANGLNCPLLLPFPGEGANFVRVDGSKLDVASISMNALVSTTAVSVTHQKNRAFLLHGSLHANDVHSFISRSALSFSRQLHEVSDGYYELNLVDIFVMVRDLFSYSADLDASVRLEIFQGALQKARIDVTQFDSQLQFDPENFIVRHVTNNLESNPDPFDLQFVPLGGEDSPTAETPVVVNDAYGWQLDRDMAASCTSLAMVKGLRARSVRPCVVYIDQPHSDSEADGLFNTLGGIFLISDWRVRMPKLSAFLSRLAENPNDDGWYEIVGAVRRYAEVHPDSLDLYSAIIDQPLVAAGVFVRLSKADLPVLLDWQDYLPFRWWQIPIATFNRAVDEYQTVVLEKYPDDAQTIFSAMIQNFSKLATEVPQIQPTVRAVLQSGSEEFENRGTGNFDPRRAFQKDLSQTLLRDLFSSHGNDEWPRGMARDEWEKMFDAQLLWLDDGGSGAGYRRPFIDAVIAQGYSIAFDRYLNRDHRAYVCAIREFDAQRFDDMLQLTVRIFTNI